MTKNSAPQVSKTVKAPIPVTELLAAELESELVAIDATLAVNSPNINADVLLDRRLEVTAQLEVRGLRDL
jgi:hypothetical protein